MKENFLQEYEQLLLEKLRLDIEGRRNPTKEKYVFIKNFWSPLVQLITVIGTFIILWLSNVFDANSKIRKAEGLSLQIQNDSLTRKKSKLNAENDSLKTIYVAAASRNDSLKIENDAIVQKNKNLEAVYNKSVAQYKKLLVESHGKIPKKQVDSLVNVNVEKVRDINRNNTWNITEQLGEYRRQLGSIAGDKIHFEKEAARLQDTVISQQMMIDGLKRLLRNCKDGIKD